MSKMPDSWWWWTAPTPIPPPPPPLPYAYGAAHGSGAGGGLFIDAAAPPIVVRAVDRSDMSTDLGVIDTAWGRTWQDQVNTAGSGSLVLYALDPNLALITLDTALRFELYGRAVFTMLPENRHQVTVAPTEEADEVATITGRSNLAILEQGLVYPSRGVDTLPIEINRAFNWTAPSTVYDDSGWGASTELISVADAQLDWPQRPFAAGFPDLDAQVIWAHTGTIVDAPVGSCFFRNDVTIVTSGYYQMCALGDNVGTLYVDGQSFLDLGGFAQVYTFLIYLTAGTHTFAAIVTNQAGGLAGHNPGGFVFALYSSTSAGNLDTLIAHSDSSWKIVEYPAFPPGMTPGNVIEVIIGEAQARGTLPAMELTFNRFVDSAGIPWPTVSDIATDVGTDYLTFLVAMSNTYIDFWIEPASLRLWVWNIRGRGVPSGVDYRASRTIGDGHSTATSTAITSATAAFDAHDVGRRITGTQLPSDVVIAAVGSPTAATLSAPALLGTTAGVWSIEGTIQELEHDTTL